MSLRPRRLIVVAVAAAAALAPASRAPVVAATQDPAPAGASGQAPAASQVPAVPTFGVSTELVYVRFHVETKAGYARDVKPEQIRVLEDGKPQKIALLETPAKNERRVTPEVTLVLDVSSSVMDAKLLDEALLRDVLFATLGEQATVGLCAFGGELVCPAAPTREASTVVDGFRRAIEFGYQQRDQGTRLYRSIADVASAKPQGEQVRRAFVVFTDGLENRGGKVDEAARAAADGDVRVYAVKLSQAFREQGIASGPFGAGRGGTGGNGGFGGRPGGTMLRLQEVRAGRAGREDGRPHVRARHPRAGRPRRHSAQDRDRGHDGECRRLRAGGRPDRQAAEGQGRGRRQVDRQDSRRREDVRALTGHRGATTLTPRYASPAVAPRPFDFAGWSALPPTSTPLPSAPTAHSAAFPPRSYTSPLSPAASCRPTSSSSGEAPPSSLAFSRSFAASSGFGS